MSNKVSCKLPTLIKINSSINYAIHDHYRKTGLTYVDVPEIVGITGACENVDTLFKVGNRLNLPLFFTQTGQLSLEQSLQYFPGVYTIIHSGRDEETEDVRHLRQFRLVEEEFDCTIAGMSLANYSENKMFTTLLSHVESAVKALVSNVVASCSHELETVYNLDTGWLKTVTQKPFYQIPYSEAVILLKWSGFTSLAFGDDLKAEHEQKVVDILNGNQKESGRQIPVFITHYPKEIKFFNMKVSQDDPKVVLSADLILPNAGEAVGSAVREHDGKKLKERLITSTMFDLHKKRGGTYSDFTWYLEDIIMAGKTKPHAGYGIGSERVMQFILNAKDIRECSLFSILSQQSGDWEEKNGSNGLKHSKRQSIVNTSKA
ncbi:hypothetical protein IPM62_05205 [Candidatus Woesebacteria bacterium]|nr:MAG: hypothetical protein IPM62_05205 [Candidatus Woesebacteria bacterium]